MKLHVKGAARGSPARSFAPVVMVTVWSVLANNGPAGVKVATIPVLSRVTVPWTGNPLFRVNVNWLMVVGSMALLKVAVMVLPVVTFVAPLVGTVTVTVGDKTRPVLKLQEKFPSSGFPAKSFAPVVMLAVKVVFCANGTLGVKVAVVPVRLMVPGTGPAPLFTVNAAGVMVVGSIVSLKVATTDAFSATPMALLAGTIAVIVGEVVSVVVPVVNVQVKSLPSGIPDVSCANLVMVTVKVVLGVSCAAGLKTALAPFTVTVPAAAPVLLLTVKVVPLIEAGFISLLKNTAMASLRKTPVAPLAGAVALTTGAGGLLMLFPSLMHAATTIITTINSKHDLNRANIVPFIISPLQPSWLHCPYNNIVRPFLCDSEYIINLTLANSQSKYRHEKSGKGINPCRFFTA